MKLAARFGADHGRLPDNLHSAAILIGGYLAEDYLKNMAGRNPDKEVENEGGNPEGAAASVQECVDAFERGL